MSEQTQEASVAANDAPAPMTDQAYRLLESFGKATLVNLVEVASMMPRGNEYRAQFVLQRVVAQVIAAWFPNNPELLDAGIDDARSVIAEGALQTQESMDAWKQAVLAEVAKQRFQRDKAGKPKILLPNQNRGPRRRH